MTFSVTHLVISETEGSFNNFEGGVKANADDFSDIGNWSFDFPVYCH